MNDVQFRTSTRSLAKSTPLLVSPNEIFYDRQALNHLRSLSAYLFVECHYPGFRCERRELIDQTAL